MTDIKTASKLAKAVAAGAVNKFPFKKDRFISFVERYYLNAKVDGAIMEVRDNEVSSLFKSFHNDIRGYITMKNFPMQNCKIGCYATGKLLQMVPILESDININIKFDDAGKEVANMVLNDSKGKKVIFAASETSIINYDGRKGPTDGYHVKVTLNAEIIYDILKANQAFDKNTGITFQQRDEKLYVIFGHSNNNTDSIEFELHTEVLEDDFDEVAFPSDTLKEILAINSKNFEEAYLEIMANGIMHLFFKDNDTEVEYWLVKLQ